jgi:integrase
MITIRSIQGLCPGEAIWDSKLPGFGARRQLKAVSYILKYRVAGRQRFVTLGKHGAITPEQARRKAQRLLGEVASGADPITPKGERLGAIIEEYLTAAAKTQRPNTFRHTKHYLLETWSMLHQLPVAAIARRDVAKALAQLEASPVVAARARTALSALFAWAIREGYEVAANPVLGTNKPVEQARDRVLSNEELASIWRACDEGDYGRIVRLLMLTGQRRDEIGKLQWSEIDGDLLTLPATRTKNHREHMLPLVPLALTQLPEQRLSREWVFGEGRGFGGWSNAKAALDRRAKLAKPWRLHDIRRSVATGLAELGILPHIIEAILNHASGHKSGVAGIYNRARYLGEMRSALERWAQHIASLTR